MNKPPEKVTGHTGRRSMATIAMQEGMDSLDVAQVTHHKNPKTLMQYVDPKRKTLQAASTVIGNVISGKSNEKLGNKRKVLDISCDCLSACQDCDSQISANKKKRPFKFAPPQSTFQKKKLALESPPNHVKNEEKQNIFQRAPQTPPDQILARLRSLSHSDKPTLSLLQDAMISGVRMAFDLTSRREDQRAEQIRLLLQGLTDADFDFDESVIKKPNKSTK